MLYFVQNVSVLSEATVETEVIDTKDTVTQAVMHVKVRPEVGVASGVPSKPPTSAIRFNSSLLIETVELFIVQGLLSVSVGSIAFFRYRVVNYFNTCWQ